MKENLKKKNKGTIILSVIITIVVLGFVSYLTVNTIAESEIYIEEDTLYIDGQYSISANITTFESVTLEDEIPKIKRKIIGASIRGVRKGKYSATDLGNCNLYLHNPEGKFILIMRGESTPILINLYDNNDTQELFNQIKSAFDELN